MSLYKLNRLTKVTQAEHDQMIRDQMVRLERLTKVTQEKSTRPRITRGQETRL